ncbi:MAG: MaoC/PaaZ C-terminal domain-containing protein [Gammaproteobacteria bacterium]|nr:MaoC/PaaZ C-terminal domain-containing protein [Gammaproteobacteria bacterium]
MALDYDDLKSRRSSGVPIAWRDRDVMLYALAVGMGRDPLDPRELAFVYEGGGLQVLPSFASVLAATDLLEGCGWDYRQVLHGAERLQLHRPLSDQGEILTAARVARVRDLGSRRGAYLDLEVAAVRAGDEAPAFTVERTLVARGDGGFGGPTDRGPAPHALPDRKPDLVCDLQTHPNQALLYRLCGDRNPLHADPALARRLDQPAPILHGLCTWGIACRAVLGTICEYDATLIRTLEGRFSAPVFPGEKLVTEMWQDANIVSFRVRAAERDIVVLSHGRCELAT